MKFGMIRDALTIADGKESISQRFAGPDIKAAFETFKDWQPVTTRRARWVGRRSRTRRPITGPAVCAMLYWIKDGKIQLLDKIDMKKKFPDKWMSWLGW